MSKNVNKLDEIKKDNPFRVPENYFDNLTQNIMSNLPERVSEEQETITLWKRMQPWVYMAAMFAGIALMIKIFVGSPDVSKNAGLNLTSSAEIEEFYQYYEEQLANSYYHESLFLNIDAEDSIPDEEDDSWMLEEDF